MIKSDIQAASLVCYNLRKLVGFFELCLAEVIGMRKLKTIRCTYKISIGPFIKTKNNNLSSDMEKLQA